SYALRYSSKPKNLVGLVQKSLKLLPVQAFLYRTQSLSFQGALLLGDWVFRAVDYPIRYSSNYT
ncbi:MAG: hypothetical protein QNJ37_14550, partial [Crocosphaera sp.]|nr:hypothetical protein [Crocosphaera sp.]